MSNFFSWWKRAFENSSMTTQKPKSMGKIETNSISKFPLGTKIIVCTMCQIPNVADKFSISTTCSNCGQHCFGLDNKAKDTTKYFPGTKVIKCVSCNIDNVATGYSNSAICVGCGQHCFA